MIVLRMMMPVLALSLFGCQRDGAQPPPTPPIAEYATVQYQSVTLTNLLPGRTAAYETSDVRPQINGLVEQRLFTEGDLVRKGQPLYRIDASPYEAHVANAQAALAKAKDYIASSAALARRYGELVKINAISKQDYENAQASAAQAEADVAAQTAALRSAQIDLARTTIRAPITGRIGRSIYTAGALVTASQSEPLATIQRIDPIYVDIQQSSTELLKLRQQLLSGRVARDSNVHVTLILEDGKTYGNEGTLRFTDVSVDPATGSQVIRAVFPNPDGLLLPGMFVRARLVEGTQKAMLIPQRAVGRDERGNATAMVIGNGDKVEQRKLETDRTVGTDWLVTGGVQPGDRVIVEGGSWLNAGTVVKPQLWISDANHSAAPAQPQDQ
ncbi:efflux RND transporter periplasmic adaptor subunit [Paraburkholderia sediminicola]|uniref:efflux RND transporter periplasmic adaptor subunit n=1 Tax=Paraburkholderia sediminicola TaxID=458836 RepID=UPI0038B963C4